MNHVLTSHTMQMIYDPTTHKSFEICSKRLSLGKIIDIFYPNTTFEKVQP